MDPPRDACSPAVSLLHIFPELNEPFPSVFRFQMFPSWWRGHKKRTKQKPDVFDDVQNPKCFHWSGLLRFFKALQFHVMTEIKYKRWDNRLLFWYSSRIRENLADEWGLFRLRLGSLNSLSMTVNYLSLTSCLNVTSRNMSYVCETHSGSGVINIFYEWE